MTRPSRHGITLVEVMIAIAIVSIVGTMVYSAFSTTALRKRRVEEDLDRHHVVATALERMAREISMAYVSAQRPQSESLWVFRTAFVGEDHGKSDRLDFTSFSHQRLVRDAHESDQNELSYFLAPHPQDSRRKVLARREQVRPDEDPRRGGRVQILLEDVRSLELEYLDPISKDWVRTWDSTSMNAQMNRLPAQVKIRIELPDPRERNRVVRFGTRAVIPLQHALNFARYVQ
ncbi:MAG: type II secretion system protein GspJ [Polyangiales bacterium]